ncbi:MAG TPA: response regulator [Coriobacteriia bacterium]|jgi:PAS domain S-box-containing protein
MGGHPEEHRRQDGLRAVLASTGEGCVLVGASGTVRLMNEAAQRLLGRARADVVGKAFKQLGQCALSEAVGDVLEHPEAGGRYIELRVEGRTVGCRVTPFDSPREQGLTISIRDETELVSQRERAEAILSSTGDGLIVFAPDNVLEYMNPAAAEMLGVDPGEWIGRRATTSELLGVEVADAGEAASCWDMRNCEEESCPAWHAEDLRCWLVSGTLCEGEPRTFREKLSDCHGCDVYMRNSRLLEECGMSFTREATLTEPVHRVVKIRTNPVIDSGGGFIGCVKSLHDITAEREISQMKNEFVSTVSHELRTPLTSIKGYVDLILDGETGEINEIQREFLGIVKQNSDRLVALINDMLDISRIESGRIHLKIEPLDMHDLITGVIDTFKAVVSQTGHQLSAEVAEPLPLVAGDRDRVGQVLINLVSNAIKYSPAGGAVTVTARKRDGQLVVGVVDEGIGISREDQEHLFDQFYRVDSSLTREIGGTGLGLSICKTIIELLGGQIWVESTLGKGSTFDFSLPIAPKELVRTPTVERPLEKGGKVLVVDHSPEIANLVEIYLRREGYDVVKAFTAEEAVRKALSERPDVITLDVMMEDVDGFDLLQRIKENRDTSQIPVVILSIVCDEGKCCRLGAAHYLEKPIDQDKLLAIVRDLVTTKETPLVLVVDDDKHIVDVLSRNLKNRGFAVASAYNGLEAVAAVEVARPDCILLDLRMPEMDGYQVIERLKGSAATAEIPIVVMTAYHFDSQRTDILHLAADQVPKPFEAEQLVEKVTALLQREERTK